MSIVSRIVTHLPKAKKAVLGLAAWRYVIALLLQFLALNQQLRAATKKSAVGQKYATWLVVLLAIAALFAAHFTRGSLLRNNKLLLSGLLQLACAWYYNVYSVEKRKKLTMEIMFLASLVVVFFISWLSILVQNCTCRNCCRLLLATTASMLLFLSVSISTAHLENPLLLSGLGDAMNYCDLEQLRIRPTADVVSWQGLVPRRLFNFYTGDEKCGARKFSWYAAESNKILAVTICPSSKLEPKVIVADPSNNDFGNLDMVDASVAGEIGGAARLWEAYLEETYGSDSAKQEYDVIRELKNGKLRIRRVLLRLKESMKVSRRKHAGALQGATSETSFGEVLYEIPIISTAMSVVCDGVEEYHVHPMDAAPRKERAREGDEPPANVLMLMIDATSRLEVSRSLPLTQHWLKRMRTELGRSHVIEEAIGLTTIGHSTNFNFAPATTGAVRYGYRPDDGTREGNLFGRLKAQYGENIAVSFLSGVCANVRYFNLGGPDEDTDGFTKSGIDREIMGPMCHSEYSSMSGNFVGPYSMVKRCIGQQFVHEHMLDLLTATVRQDRKLNRSFFQVSYLLEGHEGSHGVLKLLDADLERYLAGLAADGFFDDNRNVLLLMSDHGNHMGPYYELTQAGKIERTTPFAVWFLPRELLKRRDARRGLDAGASARQFSDRMRRVSTHFDTYLTLADLLSVPNASVHCDRESIACASDLSASLFDPSPRKRMTFNACKDFNAEPGCSLSYCSQP